jgi:hypothetical protein
MHYFYLLGIMEFPHLPPNTGLGKPQERLYFFIANWASSSPFKNAACIFPVMQTIFRQYPPPTGTKPLGQPPSADTEVGATSENARDGVRNIPKSEDFILNTNKIISIIPQSRRCLGEGD